MRCHTAQSIAQPERACQYRFRLRVMGPRRVDQGVAPVVVVIRREEAPPRARLAVAASNTSPSTHLAAASHMRVHGTRPSQGRSRAVPRSAGSHAFSAGRLFSQRSC